MLLLRPALPLESPNLPPDIVILPIVQHGELLQQRSNVMPYNERVTQFFIRAKHCMCIGCPRIHGFGLRERPLRQELVQCWLFQVITFHVCILHVTLMLIVHEVRSRGITLGKFGCLPFVSVSDSVLSGALYIASSQHNAFSERDMLVLNLLATQAAVVISSEPFSQFSDVMSDVRYHRWVPVRIPT